MSAKDLLVRPIDPRASREFICRVHYSGKCTPNTQLHFGVFYQGRLEGALQFGPPLDRSKLLPLVKGSQWQEVIELNRMAFSEALPRNSESRALGVVFRLMRKHAPQIKWVVSFADATQCGDGTIYRASGFVLTGIKASENLARLPDGSVIHKITLENDGNRPRPELGGRSYFNVTGGRYNFEAYVQAVGAEVLRGFQLRYLYFLDPAYRDRLTVPILPFSSIAEAGAAMYRGRAKG